MTTATTPIPVHLLDRAVTLIGTDTTQARYDIVTSVQIVTLLPDFVAPNVVKRQFEDIAAKLMEAQSAIDKLPNQVWRDWLHADIGGAVSRAAKLASGIPAKKRSGGSPKARHLAFQKGNAADQALGLLQHYNVNRRHHRHLAALLFEMATGRAADLKRACAALH